MDMDFTPKWAYLGLVTKANKVNVLIDWKKEKGIGS